MAMVQSLPDVLQSAPESLPKTGTLYCNSAESIPIIGFLQNNFYTNRSKTAKMTSVNILSVNLYFWVVCCAAEVRPGNKNMYIEAGT